MAHNFSYKEKVVCETKWQVIDQSRSLGTAVVNNEQQWVLYVLFLR